MPEINKLEQQVESTSWISKLDQQVENVLNWVRNDRADAPSARRLMLRLLQYHTSVIALTHTQVHVCAGISVFHEFIMYSISDAAAPMVYDKQVIPIPRGESGCFELLLPVAAVVVVVVVVVDFFRQIILPSVDYINFCYIIFFRIR